MMIAFQVSAKRLHRCRVKLRDEVLKRASLFPYFDDSGRVHSIMLVWPESPDIVLLPYRPELVHVPRFGRVTFDAERAGLRGVGAGEAAELTAGCWHEDPWWVLKAERFEGNAAVPVLKATNSAGQWRVTMADCVYQRDLSRIVGLQKPEGEVVPYVSGNLPSRCTAPSPTRRKSWRLVPFWQNHRSGLEVSR
ncbi:MAG: hypothetical protein AAF560_02655 [Acidobacteriota bacterium]